MLLCLLPGLALAHPPASDAPLRPRELRLYPVRAPLLPAPLWQFTRQQKAVRTGALAGFLAFGLAGTLFCIVVNGQLENDAKGLPVPLCALGTGLVGLAVGAGIGALIGPLPRDEPSASDPAPAPQG